jgi:hypothetical protein
MNAVSEAEKNPDRTKHRMSRANLHKSAVSINERFLQERLTGFRIGLVTC